MPCQLHQLVGRATGMGGCGSHVVLATVVNGSCASEVITRLSPWR